MMRKTRRSRTRRKTRSGSWILTGIFETMLEVLVGAFGNLLKHGFWPSHKQEA